MATGKFEKHLTTVSRHTSAIKTWDFNSKKFILIIISAIKCGMSIYCNNSCKSHQTSTFKFTYRSKLISTNSVIKFQVLRFVDRYANDMQVENMIFMTPCSIADGHQNFGGKATFTFIAPKLVPTYNTIRWRSLGDYKPDTNRVKYWRHIWKLCIILLVTCAMVITLLTAGEQKRSLIKILLNTLQGFHSNTENYCIICSFGTTNVWQKSGRSVFRIH
jgi:hypothetical protein